MTFVDLRSMLQSKKKGLSAEEKRTRMMEIFFETVGHPLMLLVFCIIFTVNVFLQYAVYFSVM